MNMQTIKDEWGRGKPWIDNFTRDFPSLETLAEGMALSNQKNSPQVGITTLADSVRQIPRESVQDIPILSAQVNGTKLSVDAIVCTYLLRAVVFNPDTFGNGILSTMQMGAQTALTTGFVALRANVGKIFNQFSTMLETLHYNDIVIEPGVFDASNSRYYHVRTRVTKGALADLIASAEANPNTKWNVPALKRLYAAGPQAFDFNRYLPSNKQHPGYGSEEQFDLVTRYGVGPYYSINVYSPQLTDSDEDMLYDDKSKSKFGYPRVSFLVIDPAQLSPFGSSRTRRASPITNYGNVYLQSTAKMQLLNADAPVFKRGLFNTQTPLRRGAQWESVDPNADVKIMELSNSTLEQFDSVMNYVDRKILSTMGVGGAASSTAQSSAYQNSDMVQGQNQEKSLSSAQVTSIIENAIRQYALTALDLYISEQIGNTPLIVDDEAKNAINQIEGPDFVGDDNVVMVDWQGLYDRIQTWTVTVDLSIRKDQLADKKRGDLQDTFTVMKQTAGQDPESNAMANALGKELIQDSVPEVAKGMEHQPVPQPMAAVGGAQPPMAQ